MPSAAIRTSAGAASSHPSRRLRAAKLRPRRSAVRARAGIDALIPRSPDGTGGRRSHEVAFRRTVARAAGHQPLTAVIRAFEFLERFVGRFLLVASDLVGD